MDVLWFILWYIVAHGNQLVINKKIDTENRENSELPLVINTWAFTEANEAAWNVLHQQPVAGSPLDALVEGCTRCEQLQCDGTVGFGGSPDEHGETTLDALVMDGATMNIGAVAAMREIKDAARVARFVLEHTQHTLLVGDAASDFAVMMGFPRESLATVQSKDMWSNWKKKNCQPNFWLNVYPDPNTQCGPYIPLSIHSTVSNAAKQRKHNFGAQHHDTIGMIVIDIDGHIFAGTSTNGARHKIPGRVGDSPIPGAGAYADNEIGAAVATGDGDIMMRFLPSLLAVEAMRSGSIPAEAAKNVMQRILRFYPEFSGGLVVARNDGIYAAACAGIKTFPYAVTFGNKTHKTIVKHVHCIA